MDRDLYFNIAVMFGINLIPEAIKNYRLQLNTGRGRNKVGVALIMLESPQYIMTRAIIRGIEQFQSLNF
jgi:hypothetical protein